MKPAQWFCPEEWAVVASDEDGCCATCEGVAYRTDERRGRMMALASDAPRAMWAAIRLLRFASEECSSKWKRDWSIVERFERKWGDR